MSKPSGVAGALAVLIAGCTAGERAFQRKAVTYQVLPIPTWSRLHIGMKVYLGDDGLGPKQTQTVCKTLVAYRNAMRAGSSRCLHGRYGTPARVRGIIPSTVSDWSYPAPFVTVSGTDVSWYGITSVLALQPDIPAGTVIVMTKKQYPVALAPCQPWCGDWGPDIGDRVSVKLLKYYPNAWDGRELYVRVLEGSYAGKTGWMFMRDTLAAGSLYAGQSALDYYSGSELVPVPI